MKYLANVTTIAVDDERCTGCGACMEVCPHAVIEVRERKAVIVDRDGCMECGACVNNCAFGALSVDKGVGCAAAIINSMVYGGEPSCDCSGDKKGSCC
ncbi:MAG: mercury methylation ferredoxin HgcB [Nitrospiraceae bacterium]|nr:mercury methylation ferredoxin HgcB [Nitrospiraceae bacterium]